jgi:hypothetical protein
MIKTYETPYLLADGTYLALTTKDKPAPNNMGLIAAKIYSFEEYTAHVAELIKEACRQ